MMLSSPVGKIAMARSSSRSRHSSSHKWVHGSNYSPRAGNSSSKNAQASQALQCHDFLRLPQQPAQDPYTTPKNKEICMTDTCSKPTQADRVMKALQAPKKRDEYYGEMTAHKQRAFDYDDLSVCEFRLTDSPNSGSIGGSTENSSQASESSREQALEEMRGQWSAFTQNIMNVQIAPRNSIRI